MGKTQILCFQPDNNSDAEQERDLEANGGRKASGEGKGSKRKSGSGFLKKSSDAKEKKKEQQAKEEEAKKASFLKEFLVEVGYRLLLWLNS